MTTQTVDLRTRVLDANDRSAALLRERLRAAGVVTFNWISSPGSGKTALLERVLRELTERGARPCAVVGDPETDNDAQRLARSGARVKQIVTHGACHLEANQVDIASSEWDPRSMDFLFIENVGNLVCPTSFDLGEDVRIALLSVTEGEDKPLKYPATFLAADAAIITKCDLAAACECDLSLLHANLRSVHPGMPVFETSAKTGQGIASLIEWMLQRRDAMKAAQAR
jgi:hydrogenase nickel incorporation protein HypB